MKYLAAGAVSLRELEKMWRPCGCEWKYVMLDTPKLSEAKRILLEKYRHGTLPQSRDVGATIPRHAEEGPAPLSFEQQQWWRIAQLAPDSPVVHESVTFYLPGLLDVGALEQSLNEIIRRHEIWRTNFWIEDGQPIQKVQQAQMLTLPVVDLRDLSKAEREGVGRKLATEAAMQPFNLAEGPLLRATLVRLDDTDHRLYLTLHDMVCDCFSLYQVLLTELRTLYEAFLVGQPSPLSPLPIQYADYASWQQKTLPESTLASHLAYWRRHLAGGAERVELPVDSVLPPSRSRRGGVHRFTLSKQLADALITLGCQNRATLHMTLLAAFNALLYSSTGQIDLPVGVSSSAGRLCAETQALAGVFTNTLLMRTNLAGNPSFRELLERVREVSVDAYAHQHVPYELVARELWPDGELSQNPLFQVQLMLEPSPPVLPSGWTATQMEIETGAAKTDLSLALCNRPEGLVGRFEYSADLFDALTIARMAEQWKVLLESVVADPDQHLSEMRLHRNIKPHQLMMERAEPVPPVADCLASPLHDSKIRPLDEAYVVPELALHRQLARIWEELLDVQPIGIRDNFFDLGGNSLLAARLIERMEQIYGKKIPFSAFFEGATIEHLAGVLLEGEHTTFQSPVVTVQAGGSRRPFFFLHGDWIHEALWCLNIARDLGPDQPFYALPPYRFESQRATLTFSEMAAAHVQSMRAVQPEGPYLLGGFCNGGLVAYEMAQQLRAAGESVDLLVLIDPYVSPAHHRLLGRFINRSGDLLGIRPVQQLYWFVRIHLLYQRIQQLRRGGLRGIVRGLATFPTSEELRDDWAGWFGWMLAGYTPRPYPGKVTIFWSSEEPVDEPNALGVSQRIAVWQKFVQAAETETRMIPGTRSSCRTKHVHALAAHLGECLLKAQTTLPGQRS